MFKYGIKYKTDKITHHGYNRFYDYFLIPYKQKRFTLFEIGIDYGRSLKMWNDMFEHAKIYGMDILHEYEHEKGFIFKGDQSNKEDLKHIISQINTEGLVEPCVDVLIDDGSHMPEHQIFTFNYCFQKMLKMDGLYIIEDIETNYWTRGTLYGNDIRCGYNKKNNVVTMFKKIVDIVNREFLLPEHIQYIKEHSNITWHCLKYISWIMFGANCIIVKKMSEEEYKRYGTRKYRFMENL